MYCCVEIKLSKNTCIQAVLYETKNQMFSKLNCINITHTRMYSVEIKDFKI